MHDGKVLLVIRELPLEVDDAVARVPRGDPRDDRQDKRDRERNQADEAEDGEFQGSTHILPDPRAG